MRAPIFFCWSGVRGNQSGGGGVIDWFSKVTGPKTGGSDPPLLVNSWMALSLSVQVSPPPHLIFEDLFRI